MIDDMLRLVMQA